MDNSNFIRDIRNHVSAGQKDAYTDQLLESARKAVAQQTAPPEQQAQLVELIKQLEALLSQVPLHALGSSATLL